MKQVLPGTTVPADLTREGAAAAILDPMFLAGGLTLSQVARLTGLAPYVIQNWVRRGFVSPPRRKRYSRGQFCRIALINMLRDALPLDRICALIAHVNGQLDDESDDLIDDAALYRCLVDLAARAWREGAGLGSDLAPWCREIAAGYAETVPGARRRVEGVLEAALTAYLAGTLRRQAEERTAALLCPEPGEKEGESI